MKEQNYFGYPSSYTREEATLCSGVKIGWVSACRQRLQSNPLCCTYGRRYRLTMANNLIQM